MGHLILNKSIEKMHHIKSKHVHFFWQGKSGIFFKTKTMKNGLSRFKLAMSNF